MLNTVQPTLTQHGYRLLFGLLCAGMVVVLMVTVLAWFSKRRARPKTPSRINFTWIIVFEAAAMGAGNSYILNNNHPAEWMVTWSTLVVGVHFLLMGWSYRRAVYYVIALLLVAGAGAGAAIGRDGDLNQMTAVSLGVLFATLTTAVVVSYLQSALSRSTTENSAVG
ncbi:hypothetical protein [Nocardia nova]|uniref:hypothetical protein n=1 Tax=Nocardia nova TaxID=37330 RepID=UPI0033D22197